MIALALYLWLALGRSDREVRRSVCAWQVRGRSDRGWAQLYRWTRRASSLFVLPRIGETAGSAKDIVLHASPIALQVFEGAALTR